MKRKGKLLICVALILLMTAGGVSAYPHLFPEPLEVIEVDVHADIVYSKPDELYEHCALVVVGVYEGDDASYAHPGTGFPRTRGTVKVTQVLKGSCEDMVSVTYRGGEIPMVESLMVQESLSKEEILKQYPDVRNQIMRTTNTEPDRVKAEAGQKYLFFLSESLVSTGLYNVNAEAYGMRPLNDKGQALNPDTQNYETLDILEEVQNTSAPE